MKPPTSVLVFTSLLLMGCPPKQPQTTTPDAELAAPQGDAAEGAAAQPQIIETEDEQLTRVMLESSEAIESGDVARIRQAIEELKGLSAIAPDRAEIPFNVGVAYEALGDDLNARKNYLRATDVEPGFGEAWLNLGAAAERRGEFGRALQSYEAGLRYDPDNPALVVGVIGVLRKQGKYSQAIARAKQALGLNANNIDAYNNLGLVYLEQDQTDLASFVYQKALNGIEGADENATLHCNLGRVYLATGKVFLARQELERALELDPSMVPAMMFLADQYLDDRNWVDAAGMLERARELEPENTAIIVNLGIAYRGLGRYEESQALYQQALDLDPQNLDPYLNLAVLQGDHMRAYEAALASLDRYLAAGGEKVQLAQQWRAELQASKDKYERELDRKQRREAREKKRKEEEELARQHEERQAAARAAADAALGKPCPSQGCPELTACNREQICVDVGSPGTFEEGQACEADADCTFGLLCGPEAACVSGASPGAGTEGTAPAPTPTEGVPAEPTPDDGSPTDTPAEGGETPWGGQ